jgi:hypothetical protein
MAFRTPDRLPERAAGEVTNPWLGIPLDDYESHMALPEVGQARLRFGQKLAGLELYVGDVQTDAFGFAPVDLVYAGLLFEYVAAQTTLARIRGMLRPGGTLVAVVQLPSAVIAEITPSPYTSLGALAPVMRLVPPELLGRLAEEHGFRAAWARTVSAADHKSFRVQAFTCESASLCP